MNSLLLLSLSTDAVQCRNQIKCALGRQHINIYVQAGSLTCFTEGLSPSHCSTSGVIIENSVLGTMGVSLGSTAFSSSTVLPRALGYCSVAITGMPSAPAPRACTGIGLLGLLHGHMNVLYFTKNVFRTPLRRVLRPGTGTVDWFQRLTMRDAVSITAGMLWITGTNLVWISHTNRAELRGTSLPRRVSCVAISCVSYYPREQGSA